MIGEEELVWEIDNIRSYPEGACKFVNEFWEHESLFNFFSFHYWQLDGNIYYSIPIFFVFIVLWFYIVGTTAEKFLSPALEKIAETCKMSESLAGVTLLAMGNGAPDVLASVSAAGSEHTGMFFSVGSLSGSGLFVTGVVSALIIIISPKQIHVSGLSMGRDIFFYMTALITVLIASIVGELNIYFAWAFFAIYLSYVTAVVIMDKYERKAKKEARRKKRLSIPKKVEPEVHVSKIGSLNMEESEDSMIEALEGEQNSLVGLEDWERSDDEEDSRDFRKILSQGVEKEDKNGIAKESEIPKAATLDTESRKSTHNGGSEWSMVLEDPMLSNKFDFDHEDTKTNQQNGKVKKVAIRKEKRSKNKNMKNILSPKIRAQKLIEQQEHRTGSFEEKNVFQKIVFIFLEAPLNFLRRLTIPPGDGDAWDRRFATVMPFFSIFFIYSVTGMIDFKSVPHFSFWILLGIAFVLSILIWFFTPMREEPKRIMVIFSVFAFLLSILWMWSAVNILVDILGVLGTVFGLEPAFLGITVLAWGNSFGEVMANTTFAKKGLGKMALTACFAAPLFDFLVGLGLSLVIK